MRVAVDEGGVLPGEKVVVDPVTGELCVELDPEETAALQADIQAAEREGVWFTIDDPVKFIDDLRAEVEAELRGTGHASVHRQGQ